jgi:tetratricopeptide (TPR) repeat protein
LNPNYPTAHHWFAYYLVLQGRMNEAFDEIKRAQQIDPLSLIINTDVGEVLFYARRYPEAIAQYKEVLQMDAEFSSAHRRLWKVYEQTGEFDEAFRMFIKNRTSWGNRPEELRALTRAYDTAGWKGVQQRWLEQRLKEAETSYVPPFSLANIYARLGKSDEAFEMLEKAYAEHSSGIVYLKVEPVFDGLRSDRRYIDLMQRVGLAAQ